MEFFRNAEINFSLCTDPLPSIKIGGEGVCTQAISLQKLTLTVNNNLCTCKQKIDGHNNEIHPTENKRRTT